MRIGSVTVAFALCWGSAAAADDAGFQLPPRWFDDSPSVKARTVDAPMIKAVHLGKDRIVFEKSRLADVMAMTGRGKIKHRGDAGQSVYWLCYRFEQNGATRQLYVTAHGEMGGPEHDVGGIVLNERAADEANCPVLPGNLSPAIADIGLGSRYSAFVHRLGPPSGRQGEQATWLFERKIHQRDSPETWFEIQSVTVEFHHGKAAILAIDQTTSD
jgi:hypothetical protein